MTTIERRWWQLPFQRISEELSTRTQVAVASARSARDDLRDSCRGCSALADIARRIVSELN